MSEPVHLCAPESPNVALCGEATSGAAGPRSATEQNGVCASCVDAMASRTIPWPPSDELVETVASMLEATDGGDYDAIARAVLDAIGGEA